LAKTSTDDWDTDPDLNTDINDISIVGSVQTVSNLDNIIREMMAQLATKLATLLSGTVATAADFLANVASRFLRTDAVWSAAGEVTLTDAATVAVDMSTFLNAKVTLAGNRALGQPSNTKVGQAGVIRIIQDATGSRTLSFHADWKFPFGVDPVLSTAAGATDLLYYQVIAANVIAASLAKAIA
jgi:hypothetical protein